MVAWAVVAATHAAALMLVGLNVLMFVSSLRWFVGRGGGFCPSALRPRGCSIGLDCLDPSSIAQGGQMPQISVENVRHFSRL